MKKLLQQHWILVAMFVLFVLLRIVTLQYHATASWDASVYVGMGKYMFSHGTVGTWEILRPVGLPLILGFFWKIGVNPYIAGMVLNIVISTALLVLIYAFAEEVKKGAGPYAAILLAATGLFFSYSAIPVTDILSSFFALLALYLLYRSATTKQYFFSGLVVAVAFNFRFPQGLLVIVGGLIIILKMFYIKKPSIQKAIEQLFVFAGGFFALIIPCLIINYYAYGNAFLPYIEGTASIKGYPSLYNLGFWYYFKQLFLQDPLFIFTLVPIGLLWQKKYRTVGICATLIALVVVMGYFLYQPHKEIRYALAFLPYIAVLSGVGLMYVLEYFKIPQLLFFGVFIIAGFMVYAGSLVYATQNQNVPAFYAFDAYLNNVPKARVLASTPYMLAYSDVLLTHNLYSDWDAAYEDYNTFQSTNDYITLDSCNLEIGCADDLACRQDKPLLLAELNKQDTKVFSAITASQCALSIYKINH